jgi:hypothetical protein
MRTGTRGLVVHAAVVGLLLTVFGVLALAGDPADGANIGAGLALLPILALGLPWTVPVWTDPSWAFALGPVGWCLVNLGPALLNVGLHAAVLRLLRRRSRHPG